MDREEVAPSPYWWAAILIAMAGMYAWTFAVSTPLYEDSPRIAMALGESHAWSLALHVVISLITGLVAVELFNTYTVALPAMGLMFVNALAVPTVAYATAENEMRVAVFAVMITWWCLNPRPWSLVIAGVLCGVCVWMKASAIGVVALPILTLLTVRRQQFRIQPEVFPFLGMLAVLAALYWSRAVKSPLDLHYSEAQAAAVWTYLGQSIVPWDIALTQDWYGVPHLLQIAALASLVGFSVTWWRLRTVYPIACFALGYAIVLVIPRVIVPHHEGSGHVMRAAELIYAYQWYPSLPGMIWMMLAAVRHIGQTA